jgi:aldehyde dehydrogenase (NAD+)
MHQINGRTVASRDGLTQEVIDPSTGRILTCVAIGSGDDVELAIASAQAAFPKWAGTSKVDRAVTLHRLADVLESRKAELAQIESVDVGKAIVNSEGFDIPFGIACVRYFADILAHINLDVPHALPHIEARTHRSSYGVCGFIFPWNFPFDLLLWNIIPALAAGNTVVIKPSPQTPLSTLFVAQLAQEAGIPDGVINVVVGDIAAGKALTNHRSIKRMSFTGSTAVGMQIGEMCGRNLTPVKLELGGKGAAVVFDDADLDSVSEQLASAITFNSGQVCCTATRWLLQKGIFDSLLEKVLVALRAKKIGPALDANTEMGPLVSKAHFNRVSTYLAKGKEQGAVALLEERTEPPAGYEDGYYMSPSLLTGPSDNICCTEEVFGPSAYILRFEDEAEAISEVNSLPYGLANSVWSSDLNRANRIAEQLIAGNNWINAHNVFAYGLPYRAVNSSGLGGGVNSFETLLEYFRPLTIARPLP